MVWGEIAEDSEWLLPPRITERKPFSCALFDDWENDWDGCSSARVWCCYNRTPRLGQHLNFGGDTFQTQSLLRPTSCRLFLRVGSSAHCRRVLQPSLLSSSWQNWLMGGCLESCRWAGERFQHHALSPLLFLYSGLVRAVSHHLRGPSFSFLLLQWDSSLLSPLCCLDIPCWCPSSLSCLWAVSNQVPSVQLHG